MVSHRKGSRPIDVKKLSDASRRSHSAVHRYEDIEYTCIGCGTESVFSADEQKHAYEVEKRYIHQTRRLCAACYAERRRLQSQVSAYREILRGTPTVEELEAIHATMKRLWTLGVTRDSAFERRISNMIDRMTGSQRPDDT